MLPTEAAITKKKQQKKSNCMDQHYPQYTIEDHKLFK